MAANEKPAEEFVPNAETVAAMTDAREGRLETVTLAQLWLFLRRLR